MLEIHFRVLIKYILHRYCTLYNVHLQYIWPRFLPAASAPPMTGSILLRGDSDYFWDSVYSIRNTKQSTQCRFFTWPAPYLFTLLDTGTYILFMDQWHVPTKVHVKEAEEKLYGTYSTLCLYYVKDFYFPSSCLSHILYKNNNEFKS